MKNCEINEKIFVAVFAEKKGSFFLNGNYERKKMGYPKKTAGIYFTKEV